MTAKKKPAAKDAGAGWWVDESVPDLTSILPKSLDAAAFTDWLRPNLVAYRNSVETRAFFPAIADERAHVKRLREVVSEASELLRTLPPRAGAEFGSRLVLNQVPLGADVADLPKRVAKDLMILGAVLRLVEGALVAPAKKGRKRETHRDAFLNAVVETLKREGIKPGAAQSSASEILKVCGATPPGELKSAARAAKRGKKLPANSR